MLKEKITFFVNHILNVQSCSNKSTTLVFVNSNYTDRYKKRLTLNFIKYYPTSTRRHGNFAGVHTLLRILLSSNSAVLINIITGVLPPHFDFVVYYVLCQC
jgi:hypothetical protein